MAEEKNRFEDVRFLRLWDLYSPLLTPHQREVTDLYFNYDLSLGEISGQKGVSRQSVSDCLSKSRAALEEYEKKLCFASMTEKLSLDYSRYATKVERWLDEQRQKYPDRAAEIEQLLAELKKDSQENGEEIVTTQTGEIRVRYGDREGGQDAETPEDSNSTDGEKQR